MLEYTEYPRVKECVSSPSTSSSPTSCVARGLTVILYPVGRDKKYSLYVSWQTTPDDGKLLNDHFSDVKRRDCMVYDDVVWFCRQP